MRALLTSPKSSYLQFGSLTLLAVLVLSVASLFLYTLIADIQARLTALGAELRSEILQCAKAYVDNRCEPETRLPAMARKCAGWEECMGREVVVVGKTRVVAETLAEVVNGFVDVISFKTMVSRGEAESLELLSKLISSYCSSLFCSAWACASTVPRWPWLICPLDQPRVMFTLRQR